MDKLMEIVKKYDMILLEDCCDALGSTYGGKLLGSFGRMATCSFYPAHHMTMGEGGFVAFDYEWDEKVGRSLRDWGRGCYCVGRKASMSQKGSCGCRFNNWLPELPDEIFDHKYVYDNIGFNLKPIELQCSMGLAQLEKLPTIHRLRKENHARLSKIFAPYEAYFHIHRAQPKADVSWFAFPLTVRNGAPFKRNTFTEYLENRKIQTRNYFGGNLLLQPAYSEWAKARNGNAKTDFPVATKVTTDTFFLGTSPVITTAQLDYIQQVVEEFFKQL
jgi:CDP-6-deoxy-D-xylo-4-hexulose-3-dehydrase